MKIYPKIHEDFHKRPSDKSIANLDCADGNFDDFIKLNRDFYNGVNRTFYEYAVKAIWLRGSLKYGGRRMALRRNGHWPDATMSFFMSAIVGISGKVLLNSNILVPLQTYFNELYPKFFEYDPFVDCKYYAFPYKNISIEHMIFVYQHHDRMKFLEYADEREMSIWDFQNWATNQAYCYNYEVKDTVYTLSQNSKRRNFQFLKKIT